MQRCAGYQPAVLHRAEVNTARAFNHNRLATLGDCTCELLRALAGSPRITTRQPILCRFVRFVHQTYNDETWCHGVLRLPHEGDGPPSNPCARWVLRARSASSISAVKVYAAIAGHKRKNADRVIGQHPTVRLSCPQVQETLTGLISSAIMATRLLNAVCLAVVISLISFAAFYAPW